MISKNTRNAVLCFQSKSCPESALERKKCVPKYTNVNCNCLILEDMESKDPTVLQRNPSNQRPCEQPLGDSGEKTLF